MGMQGYFLFTCCVKFKLTTRVSGGNTVYVSQCLRVGVLRPPPVVVSSGTKRREVLIGSVLPLFCLFLTLQFYLFSLFSAIKPRKTYAPPVLSPVHFNVDYSICPSGTGLFAFRQTGLSENSFRFAIIFSSKKNEGEIEGETETHVHKKARSAQLVGSFTI